MANDERVSKTVLAYSVDQASITSVLRSVETIDRGFKVLEGNVGSVSQTTKNLAAQIDALKRASALDQLTREFVSVGKSAKDFDGALISLRAGLKDVGASSDEIRQATDAFRDLEAQAKKANEASGGGGGTGFRLEGLRRTGSALNQLGLGAIGEPIQRIGDVGQVAKELQSATLAIAGVGAAEEGAAVGAVALSSALLPIAAVGVAAGVAFVAVSEGLKKSREEADRQIAVLDKFYETLRTGNATITEKQIADTKENIKLLEDQLKQQQENRANAILKASGGKLNVTGDPLAAIGVGLDSVAGSTKEWNDAITKTQTNLDKAKADLEGLTQALPELRIFRSVSNDIDVLKASAENFAKASQDALQKDEAAQKFYESVVATNAESKRTAAITAGEKAAADAKAITDRQNADAIKAVETYNTAKQKAIADEEQAEADIKAKYASKVADIIQASIDAADAALQKLQQREDELALNADRADEKDARKAALDDIQAQIKARRQERDDLQSHLRKVKDIEQRFRSDERDALLDRNFLQLFKLSESKKEQTSAENEAYQQQKADRAQAYADERQDAALQRDYDHKERVIALNQALADARLGYNRELEAAKQKRDRDLQIAASERDAAISLAIQKRSDVLSVLSDQYTNEVKMAYQTSAVKQAIMWNELAQAKQALAAMGVYLPGQPTTGYEPGSSNPTAGSGSVSTIKYFANTGSFNRGDIGVINDKNRRQRESINGVRMPAGIGLFVATAPGRVTDDKSSGLTLHQNITVQGNSNPELTARAVMRISREEAVKVVEKIQGVG